MTQWNYSDGSVVTSGRRFLDGNVDEEFDASEYVNGGSRRVDHRSRSGRRRHRVRRPLRACICQPAAPSTANVKIFFTRCGAAHPATPDYPRQSPFCETIDVDAPGCRRMYVEITVGELHKIKVLSLTINNPMTTSRKRLATLNWRPSAPPVHGGSTPQPRAEVNQDRYLLRTTRPSPSSTTTTHATFLLFASDSTVITNDLLGLPPTPS